MNQEDKIYNYILSGEGSPFTPPPLVDPPMKTKALFKRPVVMGGYFCRECGNPTRNLTNICQHCIPVEDLEMLAESDGDQERENG